MKPIDPRRSIVARVTIAFGAIAVGVFATVGVLLHWTLERELMRAEFDEVQRKVELVRDLLQARGAAGIDAALRLDLERMLAGHGNLLLWLHDRDGRLLFGTTRFGPMVHAQLFPGAENSGRLVALLRGKAREVAARTGRSLILADGAPGIGCPVISSLSGTDFAVLVTEPTPSGRHDLERVADLCRHFKTPTGVIVNKADLNPGNTASIRRWCAESNIQFLADLPYDPAVTEAMVRRKAVTEYSANGLSVTLRQVWQRIEALGRQKAKDPRRRSGGWR